MLINQVTEVLYSWSYCQCGFGHYFLGTIPLHERAASSWVITLYLPFLPPIVCLVDSQIWKYWKLSSWTRFRVKQVHGRVLSLMVLAAGKRCGFVTRLGVTPGLPRDQTTWCSAVQCRETHWFKQMQPVSVTLYPSVFLRIPLEIFSSGESPELIF